MKTSEGPRGTVKRAFKSGQQSKASGSSSSSSSSSYEASCGTLRAIPDMTERKKREKIVEMCKKEGCESVVLQYGIDSVERMNESSFCRWRARVKFGSEKQK